MAVTDGGLGRVFPELVQRLNGRVRSGSPQPGFDQLFLHAFTRHRSQLFLVKLSKPDTLFLLSYLDNHRLKYTTLTTVNRRHGAATRGRVANAWVPLVREEVLSQLDVIALGHRHGGFQAGSIPADQRHAADIICTFDDRFW